MRSIRLGLSALALATAAAPLIAQQIATSDLGIFVDHGVLTVTLVDSDNDVARRSFVSVLTIMEAEIMNGTIRNVPEKTDLVFYVAPDIEKLSSVRQDQLHPAVTADMFQYIRRAVPVEGYCSFDLFQNRNSDRQTVVIVVDGSGAEIGDMMNCMTTGFMSFWDVRDLQGTSPLASVAEFIELIEKP